MTPETICSITVTSNRENTIGDALRSVVDLVDIALVVWLEDGVTPHDRTLEIAREVAGDKLRVVEMKIDPSISMADMRNFGLKAAAELGASWGLRIDTDVRFLMPEGEDLHTVLSATPVSSRTLSVWNDVASHDECMLFRLPAIGRYSQGVHEEWVGDEIALLRGPRFRELPKTQEQLRARLENGDLPGLLKQVELEPGNFRWRYYLADVLFALGRPSESLKEFTHALDLATPCEKAWTLYRMAVVLHNIKKHYEALKVCCLGMAERPDYSELPWFAAIQNLYMKNYDAAITWSEIAALGTWIGQPMEVTSRHGFKEIRAFFEGPYEVMARAFDAMGGKEDMVTYALEKVTWARKEREAFVTGVRSE